MHMNTSRSLFPVCFVLVAIAVIFGYSAHTVSRVHELEARLQRAEAALQSHSQSPVDTTAAARIDALEERVQRAEAAARVQPAASSGTAGLEQRVKNVEQKIQNVEQKIEPHLATLQPYVPGK